MNDMSFNILSPVGLPSGHLVYTHEVRDLYPSKIKSYNDSEIQEIQKIITKSDTKYRFIKIMKISIYLKML